MHENQTVVNLNVSVLPCCVDYFNQCCVRIPVEEMEILLVIVLAQHTGRRIHEEYIVYGRHLMVKICSCKVWTTVLICVRFCNKYQTENKTTKFLAAIFLFI